MGNPLNPVYEAVAWVLKEIYNGLSPVFGPTSGWTWALSIVILVALMRLIMVPLFIKQMHTTRAMSALAPEMQALRKKYKNDKQTMQQETMKLYQQAGVNPLMGCLPVVLQLPMFFALFSVLRAIAEWKPGQAPKYGLTQQMVESARQAKILGVTIADKFLFSHGVPVHAKVVILAFVMISMATTYLTVRQSMKRGMMPAATPDNPMGQSQKYMMYIMPFFALSGLYWPFGRPPVRPGRPAPALRSRRARPAAAPPSHRSERSQARPDRAPPQARPTRAARTAPPGEARTVRSPGMPAARPPGPRLPARPGRHARAPSRRQTARGCCAGSARAGPIPSPRRPIPRLSSSGSNVSGSPAASALGSGEALPRCRGLAEVSRGLEVQPRT